MAEEAAAPQIQQQMMDFLTSLGVASEDQIKKGYDILMIESRVE